MQVMLGVNLQEVPSTTPSMPLGVVVEDPRGGQGQITYTWYPNGIPTLVTVTYNYSPGARFMYCKALGTISAGDSVQLDVTATQNERQASVIRTSAADQPLHGVAMAAATTGMYLWVMIEGWYKGGNVADAAAAGDPLGSTTTAGRLGAITPSADNGRGRQARAMSDGSASNTGDIYLF